MVEVSFLLLVIMVAGPICALSVLLVWIIYGYVMPARNSPAWVFIRAKKKKRPVLLLDTGTYWKITDAQHEGAGFMIDNEGSKVTITPNSVKFGLGVRIGVGEYYRSLTAAPLIAKFVQLCKDNKISATESRDALEKLEQEDDKDVRKKKEK